jgi:hypothetical protein
MTADGNIKNLKFFTPHILTSSVVTKSISLLSMVGNVSKTVNLRNFITVLHSAHFYNLMKYYCQ